MFARIDHIRILRYSGLFLWGLIGLPVLDLLQNSAFGVDEVRWIWGCYIAFGLCYYWVTQKLGRKSPNFTDYALMVVLTLSALGLGFFSGTGIGSILLMVAASAIAWLLSVRWGVVWVIVSNLISVPLFLALNDFTFSVALMQSSLYAGYCLFMFATSYVARQQAQARDEQRRLNAELRGTRLLLAESTRMTERTRISRELHDLLGHHLTALSLNLEVASHLTEGVPKQHISQAHTLAKLLLTDVREVVSKLRDTGAMNVAQALRPLADNVPGMVIHMDVQEPLMMDEPDRAHVLLRCTQEIITNAVRHSMARHLSIDVKVQNGFVHLVAKDDGQGAAHWVAGNGLKGMRERLEQFAGSVRFTTSPGRGFAVDLSLPLHTDERIAVAQTSLQE